MGKNQGIDKAITGFRMYGRAIMAERLVKEMFHISEKIFIINAKGGITANIRTVLTFIHHKEFTIT